MPCNGVANDYSNLTVAHLRSCWQVVFYVEGARHS